MCVFCLCYTCTLATRFVSQGLLGVSLGPVTELLSKELKLPGTEEALVNQVFVASSAKAAGLQAQDVLVQLEDASIETLSILFA